MVHVPFERRAYLDASAISVLVFLTALWGLQQVSVKLAVVDGLAPGLQAALRSLGAAICVALWIGEGTEGFFRNLTIAPEAP